MLAHGAGWTMLNTQHWSGCHGSTHLAYSNRSAIFRQRSTKRSFKSSLRNSRSQRRRLEHSNNRASDKPGAIHRSRQVFAVTRDPIGVNFVDGPQDYTLANYSPPTDSITIHEGYAIGSYGLFVAAHEYGHAVHEKKLGGIVITPANASEYSCANHSYTLVTNYQCALREGG